MGAPLMRTGAVSTGRLVGQHVGPVGDGALIRHQPLFSSGRHRRSRTGRGRYGTGLAGSET